jgi:outer membrane biosynthesis protein TonB
MLTREEENKTAFISAGLSVLLVGLLVLLTILWMIHVPNPPFPENLEAAGGPGNNDGIEVAMGSELAGYGPYTMPSSSSTEAPPPSTSDPAIVSADGVNINETKNENPKNTQTVTTTTTTTTTVKPNPKVNNWNNALNNANTNTSSGNTPGGTNIEGQPDGSLGGTTGGGTTGGTTSGPGGNGASTSGVKFGRKVRKLPCKVENTNAEGVVEVIIKVDKDGNVTDADPNGPNTDTSNSILKSNARQAAFCAKFDPCPECEGTSKGSIIFNFSFGGK